MRLVIPDGESKIEDTGCSDKSRAIGVLTRRRQQLEAEHANPGLAAARQNQQQLQCDLNQLLGEFVTSLIKSSPDSKYPSTTRTYVEACFNSCGWKTFGDVKEVEFAGYVAELQRKGKSPSTLRQAVGALKRFSKWVARRTRTGDPLQWIDGVSRVGPLTPRRRITVADLAKLRAAAEGLDLASRKDRGANATTVNTEQINKERSLIYGVLFETGLRTSQLRRLRRSDLTVENGKATLHIVNPPGKKRHKWGQIPISDSLAAEIQEHLNSFKGAPEDLMFRWRLNMLKRLKDDLKRAGIEQKNARGIICLHSFRHSANAALEDQGAPPTVRQCLLGHSSAVLVQTTYAAKREVDEVRSYVERLAGLVDEARSRTEDQGAVDSP
jgi:integrase